MKVQSSHTKTYVLLGALAFLILLLAGFRSTVTKNATTTGAISVNEVRPNVAQNTSLKLLQFTLTQESYNTLKASRDKALNRGVIDKEEKNYVPAIITYDGKDYKANIRLKGDWTDHLAGDKWSFRVKLKGDKTINGMKKFSVHHPKTRGYLNEWFYHKASKKERLIGMRYDFVEGAIHIKKEDGSGYTNKKVGIYAMEETFDKRLIENNQRKESIILKFSEDYWWDDVKKRIEIGRPVGLRWDAFVGTPGPWKYPIAVFSESNVLSDTTMNGYFELSKNLLENFRRGKAPIEKTFDIQQLALQNAIVNLMGADHSTHIINIRFYYNPITSKLEPISFDGNAGRKLNKYHHFMFVNEPRDSIYFRALIGALEKVSDEGYLNQLFSENKEEIGYYEGILKQEFKRSHLLKSNLKSNQQLLREELERLKGDYGSSVNLPSGSAEEVVVVSKSHDQWKKVGVETASSKLRYKGKSVVHLSRKDVENLSYAIVDETPKAISDIYTTSFIVKKGDSGDYFGLRMQGSFPNRADAIFDLNTGTVVGSKTKGSFENNKATIESLGNGWYKCTLSSRPNSKKMKIIIGATDKEKAILNWEAATSKKCDIYLAL